MHAPLTALSAIEQQLRAALRDLETLKLAFSEPAPEPAALPDFVDMVGQAVQEAFGGQEDFTEETYQKLWELSGGDAETIVDFVSRMGWRATHGKAVDRPASYAVSVVRKVGIDTLRAERLKHAASATRPVEAAARPVEPAAREWRPTAPLGSPPTFVSAEAGAVAERLSAVK